MTKKAKDLTPGDVIPVPAQDRKWLKSPLTVQSVTDGRADKRGPWLLVKATFQSPYDDRVSESVWKMRPDTDVAIIS